MNARLLTLCLSCLLVISCGGGGGSSDSSGGDGGGTGSTNSAPVVADIYDITLTSGASSTVTAVGTDSDGDSLTYRGVGQGDAA